MKTRVLKIGNLYYPQYQGSFLGWRYWGYYSDEMEGRLNFSSNAAAVLFAKGKAEEDYTPKVVWES